MSETTQNVAKIMTLMMRMNDEDFDHTLATLQQIKSNRVKHNKKKSTLTSTNKHYAEHVEK